MKVLVAEYEECFSIELFAETLGEAALLTRMGVNSKKEIRHVSTVVAEAGGGNGNSADTLGSNNRLFTFSAVLAKSRKANNSLPRRR